MALLEGLSSQTLQAGPYAQKSLYSFQNWGVSLLGSISGGVCCVFCVLYVTQAYSICTKKSLLGEACCYGGKNILKLIFPWGLFLFYVLVVVVVVSFPTFHWVAFCRIKWIKIKEPVVVAFFPPSFPSVLSLPFSFYSSVPWAPRGGRWGRGLTSPLGCREGTSCPSHLCLSVLIPTPSHPVPGPSS